MSDTETTTATTAQELSGAQALWLLTRRFVIGSFAIVGAFTIGMVMIVGLAALFDGDDDDYDEYFGEPYWEEPLRAPDPVQTRPTFANTQIASVEYRVDSSSDSIDVRADGACGDDVEYSVAETDQEIRVSAEVDSRSFACSSSNWVTLGLRDDVGDRIVVHAVAGYTARPVVR